MKKANHSFPAILIANFFFFLNFSQLLLLPKFVTHLGLTPADIGLVMGTFSIAVLVALPLVGLLSERIQKKTVFIFGAGLMCGATPFYAYVQGMGAPIIILRVIQGVGFAGAFGITAAMVFDSTLASSRRYLLGILTASNISTHAIGPAFGEYVIRTSGFELFFFSAAFFGLVGCMAAFFLPATGVSREKKAFSIRQALPFMTSTVVLGMVFGAAVIFLPPYLLTEGISDSSFFFVAFVCGSLLVWGILYRVFRRIGERVAWCLSVMLLLSLPAGVPWLKDMELLGLLSVLFGMGYGYLYPTLNALFIDLYPGLRGIANSLFVWSFNLGMLVASLGFGSISAVFGYPRSFFLSAVSGLLLLFLLARMKRR